MTNSAEISTKKTTRVFISYSSKDKGFVEKLIGELEKAGIDVFRPDLAIAPGEIWAVKIEDAINNSDVFIPIISTNIERSLWSDAELAMAVARSQGSKLKKIVPLLLESKAKSPPFLNSIQYVDFSDNSRFKERFGSLIEAIIDLHQGDLLLPKLLPVEQLFRTEQLFQEMRIINLQENLQISSLKLLWRLRITFLVVSILTVFSSIFFATWGHETTHETVFLALSTLGMIASTSLGYFLGRKVEPESVSKSKEPRSE